jgi:hypothetical protein
LLTWDAILTEETDGGVSSHHFQQKIDEKAKEAEPGDSTSQGQETLCHFIGVKTVHTGNGVWNS